MKCEVFLEMETLELILVGEQDTNRDILEMNPEMRY